MKKLQAKPFRGLLQLLASYLNNLSRRHSLLVCPVLFECFDHNRSRSTSNHCCCHISTRVCLLSILLWTPNPWFFSYVSWKEVAQLDLCLLTALTLLLVIVMHGTVCYSHFLFLHLHSHLHLSFFGCPFSIIILSFKKIVWYPFCLEKITARGFVFILCK